ncbi:hypothetical protein LTR10_018667 [Elasticomyces elasticus]|uniref:Uncharacterized protein n=1 Tax=Exophiala sideris TaxID=1016849 RepID=A0ABR0JT02_9EURO|nr:hypothetical protein LTR10_018667 [Elasticomyces elasticus]KAK5040414.1 hypothetical protein LTS07_000912 [Exophiala sideris]KAK5043160.1 hypothetical protein LTR13_000931 [Exophiala sideris]KAK5068792.1 hypothetical protein LTR69_000913 [Exophiala sideris]KAK5186389.1 hypothetical protein LTR44_001445 [Eurotiomycetes sp. CCFEE 6388]
MILNEAVALLMVLFPTYDAPHYKYGYQILIMFGALAILAVLVLEWQHKHEKNAREDRKSAVVEIANFGKVDEERDLGARKNASSSAVEPSTITVQS